MSPASGDPELMREASVGQPADHGQESRTRQRVLTTVSEHGPITAVRLAEQLGLTPTGVRRHLDALVDQGLAATTMPAPSSRGRGRPARAYVLTAAGHDRMGTEYDGVATAALEFLTEAIGPHAVTQFAQRRVADLERRYAGEVAAAGPSLLDRVHALAQALARDGFAASTRPVPGRVLPLAAPSAGPSGGVQLRQGHCPMHQVAAQFPQFCEVETEAFARLLGVHVQRLSTLASGGHVCTTFIPQPTSTEGQPQNAPEEGATP